MPFSKLLLLELAMFWVFSTGLELAVLEKEVPCDRIESSELQLRSAEGLYFYQDEPYTGQVYALYANGQLAEERELLAGKVHGVLRKWFEDGRLSFESEYEEGRRHGKTTSWWRNGEKRSLAEYVQGVPHGEQWQWYQNGNKFKRIQLIQGKQEGLQQSWRENGKMYNNYEAKNGRIFGLKRANLCYELSDENIQSNN